MPDIDVSVIIPTLNSADTLEKCLASVSLNHSRYRHEIIVVDAGSTDGTLDIARRYTDKVLNGSPARINRNQGIKEASGDVICFTDSDCIVPVGWIDMMVDGLLRLHRQDNTVAGVGGGNVPPPESTSPPRWSSPGR